MAAASCASGCATRIRTCANARFASPAISASTTAIPAHSRRWTIRTRRAAGRDRAAAVHRRPARRRAPRRRRSRRNPAQPRGAPRTRARRGRTNRAPTAAARGTRSTTPTPGSGTSRREPRARGIAGRRADALARSPRRPRRPGADRGGRGARRARSRTWRVPVAERLLIASRRRRRRRRRCAVAAAAERRRPTTLDRARDSLRPARAARRGAIDALAAPADAGRGRRARLGGARDRSATRLATAAVGARRVAAAADRRGARAPRSRALRRSRRGSAAPRATSRSVAGPLPAADGIPERGAGAATPSPAVRLDGGRGARAHAASPRVGGAGERRCADADPSVRAAAVFALRTPRDTGGRARPSPPCETTIPIPAGRRRAAAVCQRHGWAAMTSPPRPVAPAGAAHDAGRPHSGRTLPLLRDLVHERTGLSLRRQPARCPRRSAGAAGGGRGFDSLARLLLPPEVRRRGGRGVGARRSTRCRCRRPTSGASSTRCGR